MKTSFLTSCAVLMATFSFYTLHSSAATPIDSGINYDPDHSIRYINAQKDDDLNTMQAVIDEDMKAIKKTGLFTTIKTFYSQFAGIRTGSPTPLPVAELAKNNGLKVLLGVFEFADHEDWSNGQVDAAITQANKYPETVVGIVVGSENFINRKTGQWNPDMIRRIASNMKQIRDRVNNKNLPILTAQTADEWTQLVNQYSRDDNAIALLAAMTHTGLNDYPFWIGKEVTCNETDCVASGSVRPLVVKKAETIAALTKKPVVITEEGWPTGGQPGQIGPTNKPLYNMTIEAQKLYFKDWKDDPKSIPSFYFAMYDKIPTREKPQDADYNFGLCTIGREVKSPDLTNSCQ